MPYRRKKLTFAISSSDEFLSILVTDGRGSVRLLQPFNMLCTSGFVDDKAFAERLA